MEGHPLLTQMFGNKKYQYKLELQEPIPSTIFKERNINISLKLIDKNSQKVLNCKFFSIQPTLSTSVWEFAMKMVIGLLRIRPVRAS
jgi:hypothetical protein